MLSIGLNTKDTAVIPIKFEFKEVVTSNNRRVDRLKNKMHQIRTRAQKKTNWLMVSQCEGSKDCFICNVVYLGQGVMPPPRHVHPEPVNAALFGEAVL